MGLLSKRGLGIVIVATTITISATTSAAATTVTTSTMAATTTVIVTSTTTVAISTMPGFGRRGTGVVALRRCDLEPFFKEDRAFPDHVGLVGGTNVEDTGVIAMVVELVVDSVVQKSFCAHPGVIWPKVDDANGLVALLDGALVDVITVLHDGLEVRPCHFFVAVLVLN